MLGDKMRMGADELCESQQTNIFQVRIADDKKAAELGDADRGDVVARRGIDDVGEEAPGDEARDTFIEKGHSRSGADEGGDWGDEFFYQARLEGGKGRKLDPGDIS